MTTTIDIQKLFSHLEPWDCSNSVANLGSRAAELTWDCAMELAAKVDEWLLSDRADALNAIVDWACETGAWTLEELQGWSEQECFALLVQNVASDMRLMGSDDLRWPELLEQYNTTDWDTAPEYPNGHLYSKDGRLLYEVYE